MVSRGIALVTAAAVAVGTGIGIGVPAALAANDWGTAQIADENPDTNGFGTSELTMSGDGTQAVFRRSGASTPEELTSSTRTFGTWSASQQVPQGSLTQPTAPMIANGGNTFAVQLKDGSVRGVYVSRFASGSWGSYEPVNGPLGGNYGAVLPTISGDGNTVAWQRQDFDFVEPKDAYVSTYSAGSWSTVGPLNDPASP